MKKLLISLIVIATLVLAGIITFQMTADADESYPECESTLDLPASWWEEIYTETWSLNFRSSNWAAMKNLSACIIEASPESPYGYIALAHAFANERQVDKAIELYRIGATKPGAWFEDKNDLMLRVHFASTNEEVLELLKTATQTLSVNDPELFNIWTEYATELILVALREDKPELFIKSKVALVKASLLGSSPDLNWAKYLWITNQNSISCTAGIEEDGKPEQVLRIVELLRESHPVEAANCLLANPQVETPEGRLNTIHSLLMGGADQELLNLAVQFYSEVGHQHLADLLNESIIPAETDRIILVSVNCMDELDFDNKQAVATCMVANRAESQNYWNHGENYDSTIESALLSSFGWSWFTAMEVYYEEMGDTYRQSNFAYLGYFGHDQLVRTLKQIEDVQELDQVDWQTAENRYKFYQRVASFFRWLQYSWN